MKQILFNNDGVLVARMPAPTISPYCLLVRNRFSLISTGTETANLKNSGAPAAKPAPGVYRLFQQNLPDYAQWQVQGASTGERENSGAYLVRTDPGKYAYVLSSPLISLRPGCTHAFVGTVQIREGNLGCGLLAADGSVWLKQQVYDHPLPELRFHLELTAPAAQPLPVRVMFYNFRPAGEAVSVFTPAPMTLYSWTEAVEATPEETGGADEAKIKGAEVPAPFRAAFRKCRTLFAFGAKAAAGAVVAQEGGENPEGVLVRAEDLPTSELDQQGWSLGYSSAGEVVAVGDKVRRFSVGDRVACAGAGLANHAEVVSVPENLAVHLPAGTDFRDGCSATVGAIALQGVRRAEIALGERVAVVGLGLIGQITAALVRAAGGKVIGFDPQASRVNRCKYLHDGCTDPQRLEQLILAWTGGNGADAVIVTAATKSAAPINLAMRVCRRRGRVVISGDVDIHPERAEFYKKEIDLRMATSYGPGRYDADYELHGQDYPYGYVRFTANRNMASYLEFVADGAVDFASLVGAVYPLEEAGQAYQALTEAEEKPLAVLLEYPAAPPPAADNCIEVKGGIPPRAGAVRFALVGAGGFAQSMLAPKLTAMSGQFQFAGVVSSHGTEGSNFARRMGVRHLATGLEPLLDQAQIELFVVATRHHLHAGQVCQILRAGKPVFVEKPLAITWDQLDAVAQTCRQCPAALLMVGYNRRFSPAVQRLQAELAGRKGPLMIVYRMNAGFIPATHWVQTAEGGGRNLGEACHMYDLFRALARAPVESVWAAPVAPRPANCQANDNFTATVRYADGTLATLIYTALGPKGGLSKERMEVFCDAEAYVLDDYQALFKAGQEKPLWAGDTDKGHDHELWTLGEVVAGRQPPPIPMAELLETSAVALSVEEYL